MAQLYADENFPLPVVEELRRLGHDVLTIQEDGKANQRYPDEAVLRTAVEKKRAVLTTNRKHFIGLHLASSDHHGVIVCTFDPDFVGQANRIDAEIRAHKLLASQLIRINRPT
jgi:hypothetical protein